MKRHLLIPVSGIAIAVAAATEAIARQDAEILPVRRPTYYEFEGAKIQRRSKSDAPRSPRKSFKKSSKR